VAEPIEEPWSWSRWFGSLVSGRRYGKTIALMLQMAIIIAFLGSAALGILWLKERLLPSKGTPKEPTQITTTGDGTEVDNSTKKSEFDGFSFLNIKFGGTNQ
jgi:hypothetical protein